MSGRCTQDGAGEKRGGGAVSIKERVTTSTFLFYLLIRPRLSSGLDKISRPLTNDRNPTFLITSLSTPPKENFLDQILVSYYYVFYSEFTF